MDSLQPKPDSKIYSDLISDVERGVIKVPKFQRDFVWSIEKTANLLDSIVKGYPIGTFILWQTDTRLNDVKNIGNFDIPETPEGTKIQYVLDGQQRITSLFAAYRGETIRKPGEKKVTDYKNIFVSLDVDINPDEDQIITSEPVGEKYLPLHEILNFGVTDYPQLAERFTSEEMNRAFDYSKIFATYSFSTIILRKEDVNSAIQVFTRINTGGQTLTLFEIMAAKTYDEGQNFDMQVKWNNFIDELKDAKYDEISSRVILNLMSLIHSTSKECKQTTILALDKQVIINGWDGCISVIKDSIDYFRQTYRIPVSRLLPYDSLIVPFAYFFHKKGGQPDPDQAKYLEEFFWRVSLSNRYSSATESKLAQDIKRITDILQNQRPKYDDIRVDLDSAQALIERNFTASNSYTKAILCILAYHQPKDFSDNSIVNLDNSSLKQAKGKNYHHFFPKAYLAKEEIENENSLMNIVLVSDYLNKQKIGAKAPSKYIGEFSKKNNELEETLQSHLISMKDFGIMEDDYEKFLEARATKVFEALHKRLNSG
jgi:hypothetical protein